MPFYKKHIKFIKVSSLITASSSITWLTYQIWKAHDILNNALDTSVIDFMEPSSNAIHKATDEYLVIDKIKHHESTSFSVGRLWYSLKFAYCVRLLNLANNDDKKTRIKAVKCLGSVHNLGNWHYSLLAHMCDARTAAGLARIKDVDLKFFLEPPFRYVSYNHEMLVNTMKEFLIVLHAKSKHLCMEYFISRAFVDVQEVGHTVDHDHASVELIKFIQNADDTVIACLESILHHSSVEEYARDIVLLNGLPLLMEIHNRFKNNIDVNVTLCRILSNICTYPEHLEDVFRSGWLGVLAAWLQNSDLRISATAAKSLANLDRDDTVQYAYPRRIYLLHPFCRSEKEPDVDVVFVHGLLGGVFYTWRQRLKNEDATIGLLESITVMDTCPTKQLMKSSDPNVREYLEDLQQQKKMEWEHIGKGLEFVWSDIPSNTNDEANGPYSCPANCVDSDDDSLECYTQCWPRDWLPEDCENLRVIGINYDTSLSMWAPICPSEDLKTNLDERSNEFLEKLVQAGLGKKPILWVTHSMGGLIVKNILCKAFESKIKEVRDISLNTKSIVFYSTPHFGSRIAKINQAIALVLWPSVEVQELQEESPHLVKLHDKFLNIVEELSIKVVSFVETKSTVVTALKFNFLFVEPHSADPKVGEYYEIPQDHLGICKPVNRHSFLYQKILHLIQDVRQKWPSQQC